jgi:shikimate dehydrogenase
MLKLALIGRSIQHSQSKTIYQQLIPQKFSYTLLDINEKSDLPSAQDLLNQYSAVNITAPYKNHFLDQINNQSEFKALAAINLLYKKNGLILGANTDYLALVQEVESGRLDDFKHFVILGNGAMARVWQEILEQFSLPFVQFYRKKHGALDQLDLSHLSHSLIINCCSRDYIFAGKMDSSSLFWNMNYSLPQQEKLITSLGCPYRDGLDLLKMQAIHATQLFL